MISKEEVQELAELARLEISAAEVEALQKDISGILEYVGQVGAGAGGEGQGHSPLQNVLREDTLRESSDPLAGSRDALLEALPAREGGSAVVRKIIEK
jgi:aspartyl-tRNA(Asn)/glutamyl-tRNA(Gln) amidotransferase subunit C